MRAEEERCPTCGSPDPREVWDWLDARCGDPYHASTWDDE
jgi:hypothetical protein